MRLAFAALLVAGAVLHACPAKAHDVRPGGVALRETAPGRFTVRLTPPRDGSNGPVPMRPRWPAGCVEDAADIVCDEGLRGVVQLPSLARRRVKVVVHVRWLDGSRFERLLVEGQSTVQIRGGSADDGLSRDVGGYVAIGLEHIFGGLDHLLFVLALALLTRTPQRTALAVTGFTVAHSITLAASALGAVHPPSAVVELLIAASVLFLAAEVARDGDTLTKRAPMAIAALFGLVHGFGFAGALAELGLPRSSTLSALALFNVGVEAGQLLVLAGAGVAAMAIARFASEQVQRRGRVLAIYAIGSLAGIWTIERAALWASVL